MTIVGKNGLKSLPINSLKYKIESSNYSKTTFFVFHFIYPTKAIDVRQ
jgi:hypothetical protein